MTKDLCQTCIFSNWNTYPVYNTDVVTMKTYGRRYYLRIIRYDIAKTCLKNLKTKNKPITKCKQYQHQDEQVRFTDSPFILRTTYKQARKKQMVKTEQISEFVLPAMIKAHGSTVELLPNIGTEKECGYIRDAKDTPFKRATIEFEIKFVKDGLQKKLTMNKTTFRKCADTWGDDSDTWLGKYVKLEVLAQMVRGEKRNVIYGTPQK